MDDILKELSLHRLSRAREVREEAELLFSEGHYCSAKIAVIIRFTTQ